MKKPLAEKGEWRAIPGPCGRAARIRVLPEGRLRQDLGRSTEKYHNKVSKY